MSLSEGELRRAVWRDPDVGVSRALLPVRLPVYVVCTLLALLSSYLLGRDLLWDTLNYHLYAGFSAVHDRFAQDYFAAGPAGYLNPYVYVPFYALVSSGLSALAIASLLAAAQSVILWLTYELALCAAPPGDGRTRAAIGVGTVLFAFLNPILIQQFGSSYADVTTASLDVAAWLLLARAVRTPRLAWVLWGGLALGASTALKPTNAVHAVAGTVLLTMLPGAWPYRIRCALGYIGAGALGYAIVAAPWAYRIQQEFGSPFFPLFTSLFPAKGFPTEAWVSLRFIPASLGEALWRPFAIVNPVAMVQQETMAPDLRYALLAVLGAAVLLRWCWLRLKPAAMHTAMLDRDPSIRVLAALACGFTLDWALWLKTSGNGRYLLPMGSVAAVLVVSLVFRLLASRPKLRNAALAGIFAMQALGVCMGANYRWDPRPWGGPWLRVEVPQRLATEADLYLTIGVQSNSLIAPYLDRGSGLINFSGGFALSPEGAGGARIAQLIRAYAPRVRVLINGAQLYADDEHYEPHRSSVDAALARFGLRVDPGDCARIALIGVPHDIVIAVKGARPQEAPPPDTTYLTTCRVIPDHSDQSARLAQQRIADRVFDALEDACPQLFQPRHMLSEKTGATWQRLYLNTDLEARINGGWLRFFDPVRGEDPVLLGSVNEWLAQPPRLACWRHNGLYFAKILGPRPGS